MAMTGEELRARMVFQVDIKDGLIQRPIRSQLMKGDKNANTIVVLVKDGEKEADLSGATATGSFISPLDGAEIPLEGSVEGGKISVVLKDECYAEDGFFEASVQLSVGETSRTILSVTGDVLSKGSGAVINIGDVIPSIDDIIAQYAEMKRVTRETQDAADAATTAASKSPYVDPVSKNWMTWSAADGKYVDSGVSAKGEQGPQGPPGQDGTGAGTVTGIMIGTETYEPDDTGVVELPETGGAGVPDGGATGQMLFKTSDEDGDAEWKTPTHDKVGALGSDPQEEESTEAPELGSVPVNADKLGGFSLAEIMLKLYPVGAIYTSTVETNPQTLFGGTWEQIKGRFLIGTGAPENNDDGTSPGSYNYAAGSKGGEANHSHSLTNSKTFAEILVADSGAIYQNQVNNSDSVWTANQFANYAVQRTDISGTIAGAVGVYGATENESTTPPYLSVYMWKRVS